MFGSDAITPGHHSYNIAIVACAQDVSMTDPVSVALSNGIGLIT